MARKDVALGQTIKESHDQLSERGKSRQAPGVAEEDGEGDERKEGTDNRNLVLKFKKLHERDYARKVSLWREARSRILTKGNLASRFEPREKKVGIKKNRGK